MESLWSHSIAGERESLSFPSLDGDRETEVLIVGGGIAGILCAHQLASRGIPYIVVEAKNIFSGMTQNTTAKITSQHGPIYQTLLRKNGRDYAKAYYQANQEALAAYKTLADEYPCDFEEQTAYIYSTQGRNILEREGAAYQQLGIAYRFQEQPPLPLPNDGALGMEGQGQFHPLKMLLPLAKSLQIYEHTYVEHIEGTTAITEHGRIRANHIILATHYPFINVPGKYFVKLTQERSYAIALENAAALDGMYIDAQPFGHSFRNYGELLLLGGGGQKTGKDGGKWEQLRGLQRYAYPEAKELFAWAAQDCMTLDQVPYIGRHRSATANLYVATGFDKWGMTSAMVASRLLADLIEKGHSPYEEVFAPNRSLLKPKLFGNLGTAIAQIVRPGKRCTHLGCSLHWNAEENSWDCACHGSRFDHAGHLINNPAKRGKNIE